MSAFGAAMKAVRNVMLMQTRVDTLQEKIEEQAVNVKTLTTSVIDIDRRLARVEGKIEGVAMAGRASRALPRE